MGANLIVGAAAAPTREELASWRNAPPPSYPRLRSSGQNDAYHGKCTNLGAVQLGPLATPAEIARAARVYKRSALEWASHQFGRSIESSKELTHDEMSEVLDWLDAETELAEQTLESTTP
jgi:hypothetical protein